MQIPTELQRKIAKAREVRGRVQCQINEYLRMADPTRPRIGDDIKNPTARNAEADDRYDTTLEEVGEDFASDLIDRLMPRKSNWLQYEAEQGLPPETKAQLDAPLAARSDAIFAAVRKSNFYDEAVGEWALDQGHGTSAVYIVDPGAAQPFYCEAIPPHQLLLLRGSRGLSFKGRECAWEIGEAVAFWPQYKWTQRQRTDAADEKKSCLPVLMTETATLIPFPGEERWKWRVTADKELVHEAVLIGRGSCPIIASRWRTHSASPWGIGPMLKSVPDARTLDQERYLVLKNLGKVVDPPVSYEDDGVTSYDDGVSPGDWIPRAPNSKAPEPIVTESRMDLAYFEEQGLQDKIRRSGYQAGPRQRGKTPPTLGQWMDEKAEQGRRLQMPTGKLYAEGVIAICDRFEYLLIQAGKIDPAIKVGQSEVRVRPLNPLARQQDFEEVQVATQLLSTGNSTFGPQVMGALIDGAQTFANLQKKLNDKLIVVRTGDQANTLLESALGVNVDASGGQPAAAAAPPEGQ